MKFEIVLFDADDTLFDFRRTEKECFAATLNEFGILDGHDKLYSAYRTLSHALWGAFEKGEITKDFLRLERFRRLFSTHPKAPPAETFSIAYLGRVQEGTHLINGAVPLCRRLQGKVRVGIVTNGIGEVQRKRLELSPLKPFVEFMVVSEDCGFAKPHPAIFECALELARTNSKSSVIVIGDRLETDILGAQRSGLISGWLNLTGQENQTQIRPHHEFESLYKVGEFLTRP